MSIDHHTLCTNYLANSWHALPPHNGSGSHVEESQAAPASLHGVRASTTDGLIGRGQCGERDCDEQLDRTGPKPWDWPWDWWGLWKSWYVMVQLRVGKQCVDLGLDPEAKNDDRNSEGESLPLRTLLHFLIVYAQHPSYWTLAWRSWLGLNRFFTFIFRFMPFWNVLAWNSTCLLVTYLYLYHIYKYVKSCKYTQIL